VLYLSLCTLAVVLLMTASFDASASGAMLAAGGLAGSAPAIIAGAAAAGIQALREKRNDLARQANDLLEKHPKDKRLPDDVSQRVDALIDECGSIDARIKQEQRVLDLQAAEHFQQRGVTVAPGSESAPRALFGKFLRFGSRALSVDEHHAIRASLPESIRNTMSTTTGSEGGNTVQTDVARELIRSLKEYGGMRQVADVFSTEGGNPMNFPTNDATSEVGELIGENTTATAADPTFGTVAVNAFKYSSKIVAVPFELLQDSQIDIEALVRAILAERLGRITNQHFTTGTGSGQPRGIVTGSSLGKTGTTGQVTTIIYDDVVDLFHSVDPAYRKLPGSGFMTSDAGVKMLRKVKDSQNRPIFVPGYETTIPGASGSAPDTLLGAPLYVNNDIAVPAASAKSLIFGNLKKYKIRDVMAMTLFRFEDSAYAKLGQVGFLCWMRAGGNLVDTGAVKHYVHPAS
jgi:HK97 family phage major capsid protein